MDEMTYDLPSAKRVFSRVGLSLTAILAIGLTLSFAISFFMAASGVSAFSRNPGLCGWYPSCPFMASPFLWACWS